MPELYSKPLSPEARKKFVDFLEAYFESARVATIDEKAEIAKQKAIALLQTDIDILMFVTILLIIKETGMIITRSIERGTPSRKIAEDIMRLTELARRIDKFGRPGGNPN